MVEQFTAIRDGDRFWYQNRFQGEQLREIERTRLSDVIERNTGLTSIQDNAFIAPGEGLDRPDRPDRPLPPPPRDDADQPHRPHRRGPSDAATDPPVDQPTAASDEVDASPNEGETQGLDAMAVDQILAEMGRPSPR